MSFTLVVHMNSGFREDSFDLKCLDRYGGCLSSGVRR